MSAAPELLKNNKVPHQHSDAVRPDVHRFAEHHGANDGDELEMSSIYTQDTTDDPMASFVHDLPHDVDEDRPDVLEGTELGLQVQELNDRRAFTIPDSGYGTASKAATSTGYHQSTRLDADFDDLASVMTDNLPLDLPGVVGNAYVNEFVERILEATRQVPAQEIQRSELIRILPDLLRAFALRVSFTEGTAEGRAVGVFTRQNKE